MDLAQLAGADYQEFPIAGRVYRVYELTLGDWGHLQAWIKAHAPKPLASIRSQDLDGLSPADRRAILGRAYEEGLAWPPRICSPAWFLALDAPGGHAALLHALLSRGTPGLTLDDCQALADSEGLAIEQVLHMVLVAMGAADDPRPKAPAPGSTTARTTTRGPRPAPTTSAPRPSTSRRRGDGPKRPSPG